MKVTLNLQLKKAVCSPSHSCHSKYRSAAAADGKTPAEQVTSLTAQNRRRCGDTPLFMRHAVNVLFKLKRDAFEREEKKAFKGV